MLEKIQAKKVRERISMKNWVAYVVFGAIILVFALMGITPGTLGGGVGGAAAVVNHTTIPINEFRNRMENIERETQLNFSQFPEAQRQAFAMQMRRRVLEDLVMAEVVYQNASKKGVLAADGEVRDYLLEIPFLQENGRFLKERYRAFLQNMNYSTEDFERQIRKQIVTQKIQGLFMGAAAPTREELRRGQLLATQKLNVKFVEIRSEDWTRPGMLNDAEVRSFLSQNKDQVAKSYQDNLIDYTSGDKVRARYILLRAEPGQNEEALMKKAQDLRQKLTPENFAKMATQHSQDFGSKSKGGDLGEFERGHLNPEVEKVAFGLDSRQISDVIKTSGEAHIIFVEKKTPARTQPLNEVEMDVARKLMLRSQADVLTAQLRGLVENGSTAQLNAWLQKGGLKWIESGEFDLSQPTIPKLGENPAVIQAIVDQPKKRGLVPRLIESDGRYVIVDVVSWNETPGKGEPMVAELNRALASRKSANIIETWAQEIQSEAHIEMNNRLLQ